MTRQDILNEGLKHKYFTFITILYLFFVTSKISVIPFRQETRINVQREFACNSKHLHWES